MEEHTKVKRKNIRNLTEYSQRSLLVAENATSVLEKAV